MHESLTCMWQVVAAVQSAVEDCTVMVAVPPPLQLGPGTNERERSLKKAISAKQVTMVWTCVAKG